jgi:hypothetical protein
MLLVQRILSSLTLYLSEIFAIVSPFSIVYAFTFSVFPVPVVARIGAIGTTLSPPPSVSTGRTNPPSDIAYAPIFSSHPSYAVMILVSSNSPTSDSRPDPIADSEGYIGRIMTSARVNILNLLNISHALPIFT